MQNRITKSTLMTLFLFLAFSLQNTLSEAAVAVQTEIVSGTISHIFDNQSIELDNGLTYHPSRQGLVTNVSEGSPITLRYVTQDDEKNIFFEFALGLHSLEKLDLPESNRDNSKQ